MNIINIDSCLDFPSNSTIKLERLRLEAGKTRECLAKSLPKGSEAKFKGAGFSGIRLLAVSASQPVIEFRANGKFRYISGVPTAIPRLWLLSTHELDEAGYFSVSTHSEKDVFLIVSCEKIEQFPAEYFESPREEVVVEWLTFSLPPVIFSALVLNFLIRNQFFTDIERGLAVLFTSVSAIAAYLGLRVSLSWVKAPFDFLRNRIGNKSTIFISSVMLALSLNFLIHPVSCLLNSYQYERFLINSLKSEDQSIKIDSALSAIKLVPERLEAFFVLERIAGQLRASDRNAQIAFYNDFLQNAAVLEAITDTINGDRQCHCLDLSDDELTYNKRQILSWLFHAAEISHGYRDGVNDHLDQDGQRIPPQVPMFEGRIKPEIRETNMYRMRRALYEMERTNYTDVLQYYSSSRNRDIANKREIPGRPHMGVPNVVVFADGQYKKILKLLYAESPKEIRDRVSLGLRENFPSDYVVQIALDKVIKHDLLTCDFDSVLDFIPELIHLREQLLLTERIWLFGPDTLQTFQVFRALRVTEESSMSHVYLPSYNQLTNISRCDNWERRAEEPDMWDKVRATFMVPQASSTPASARLRSQLKQDFPRWLDPSEREWLRNTIDGLSWAQINTLVRDQVKTNWRY